LGKMTGARDGSAAGGSPCDAGPRRRLGLTIGAEAVRSALTGLDCRGNSRKATWKAAGARRPPGMTAISAHQTAGVDAQRTLRSTLRGGRIGIGNEGPIVDDRSPIDFDGRVITAKAKLDVGDVELHLAGRPQ
jgi:hypothetical protein